MGILMRGFFSTLALDNCRNIIRRFLLISFRALSWFLDIFPSWWGNGFSCMEIIVPRYTHQTGSLWIRRCKLPSLHIISQVQYLTPNGLSPRWGFFSSSARLRSSGCGLQIELYPTQISKMVSPFIAISHLWTSYTESPNRPSRNARLHLRDDSSSS